MPAPDAIRALFSPDRTYPAGFPPIDDHPVIECPDADLNARIQDGRSPAFHPAPCSRLRYLSVCSGIEAASVAWEPLGWKAVGFSEIEPFPCAILKHRFPNTPNYGSLTEYQSWPIKSGTIDVLVGGTPCQSFSVAGLRKGMSDPRGNLALTFLGLADRLKPKWIVWENVPGVLSSNGGRDFGSFLGALVELGYGFAYRVLDAQHFGVPQRRRRVFVVACLGDWRSPAEVLSLREGLRGYLEAGGKKRKGVAADAGASPTTGCWWDGGQVSQTLDAVLSKGQTMPEKNRFPAVLQPAIPFRKSKRAASTTDNETWVPAEVTNTLNNFDLGDTRTTHAVVEPFAWTQNQREEVRILGDKAGAVTLPGTHQSNYIAEPVTHSMPGSVAPTVTSSGPPYSRTGNERVEGEVSNTLNNFDLGDTRTTHAVVEPIPLDLRNATRDPEKHDEQNRQGVGVGDHGDPAHTLTKEFVHGVAHCSDVAPTVTSSGPPYSRTGNERVEAEALVVQPCYPINTLTLGGRPDPTNDRRMTMGVGSDGDPHFTLQAAHSHAVATTMAVRRLTPVECERLQGFPDNWSRIPWKGKPEEDCPDGPRYKACGNSMAVPVMRWIGQGIHTSNNT